jgi:hypothetical protein
VWLDQVVMLGMWCDMMVRSLVRTRVVVSSVSHNSVRQWCSLLSSSLLWQVQGAIQRAAVGVVEMPVGLHSMCVADCVVGEATRGLKGPTSPWKGCCVGYICGC